jgi:hypothetical protein
MAEKSSANIFGTFLTTVQPGPSKPDVDLSRLTQSVIDWSERQQSAESLTPPGGTPAVIPKLARAITDAAAPLSIIELVKSTNLDVDTVASALRDATATGLLQLKEQPDGTRLFSLTPDGRQLLVDLGASK